ncbi:MAG: amidase domain-containing protein [Syntrophomonadaceae bacterium]|nr:amidase domain-containing protein [Syntrophomonadaceae bacterium]
MPRTYNRAAAVAYAHEWAYSRNPRYYDFSGIGGDCTNYASQVLYAGSQVMNYSSDNPWYYNNLNSRSPSWTDVDLLHKFLVTNRTRGPYAIETDVSRMSPGDIIQLSFVGRNDFNHSPVVVAVGNPPQLNNILIAAHSADRDHYPLTNYHWLHIRFLHILGVY